MGKSKRTPIIDKAVFSGKIDLIFNKEGLNNFNKFPDFYEKVANEEFIVQNITDEMLGAEYPINPFENETISIYAKAGITIEKIELKRLSEVTDEEAIRAGVEEIPGKGFKHYCPQRFFPKEVLRKQEHGYPYMESAKTSFATLWAKKYGIMDAFYNPWVWQYTLVTNKN